MYSKAKKSILHRKELQVDKIKLICYTILKGNDTAREIKKGIDKGCKICYNVYIADTKASAT